MEKEKKEEKVLEKLAQEDFKKQIELIQNFKPKESDLNKTKDFVWSISQ